MKRFSLPVSFTNYLVVPVPGHEDHGTCEFDAKQIVISKKFTTKDAERLTLWHEFFHALMHELGYDELRDDDAFVEDMAVAIMRVRLEQEWL